CQLGLSQPGRLRPATSRDHHVQLLDGVDRQQPRAEPSLRSHAGAAHRAPDPPAGLLMQKRAPTIWQLGTIVGFALSCFGILLFLWVTFGGPTPLKARSYTVKIPFTEAATLAQQSDVRISGVSVGKVQGISLAPDRKHALATL